MSPERGAALLLVVLLVALLAVMVVEFQREASMEIRAAANLRDTLQAHAFVRSGASAGSALLLADLEDNDFDARDDLWTRAGDYTSLLGLEVEIEDLDGKFPLGALVNDEGEVQERYVDAYRRLLEAVGRHLKEQPELEDADLLDRADLPGLVDALVDWIDGDDVGDYEAYVDSDYTVPNGRLTGPDELYRVAGYNVVPEGYSHSFAEAILPYMDTRSETEINVNTADVPVLAALHPDMDYEKAAQLYEEIGSEPSEKSFRPKDYPSVEKIAWTQSPFSLATKSERFRVRLGAEVGGVYHTAESMLLRDEKDKTVQTVEWREGWMRRHWTHRRTQVAPSPGGLLE